MFATAAPIAPEDVLVDLGGCVFNAKGSWQFCPKDAYKTVRMVYDVIPCTHPQFFPHGDPEVFSAWLKARLAGTDLILTISQHTKKQILEYAQLHRLHTPAIEVVRLGESLCKDPAAHPPNGMDPQRAFALSVGTLEVRKNHALLYHVWQSLVRTLGSEHTPLLVLVGGEGWICQDILHQIRTDPLTANNIVIMRHLPDPELSWLYHHCLFTMYPSFYEGYGLPAAESLAHGKCCIASNASSLPEVSSDLLMLHDPHDWRACLEMAARLITDSEHLRGREEQIRAQYQRTTWSDCAAHIAGHIDTLLGTRFQVEPRTPFAA